MTRARASQSGPAEATGIVTHGDVKLFPATAFARNRVVVLRNGQAETLFRLLAADGDHWAWIQLPVRAAWPVWVAVAQLHEMLQSGNLVMLDEDPMGPPRAASRQARREGMRRWKILAPALRPGDLRLFFPDSRVELVRSLCESSDTPEYLIRRWSRRFWERGQVPEALIPSYEQRGGPGKVRTPSEAKRGRPPLDATGADVPGVNVDQEIRKKIERGGKKFWLDQGMPWSKAWLHTLAEEFGRPAPTESELRRGPELLSDHPSLHQFKYWCRKAFGSDPQSTARKREGVDTFNAKVRPSLHSAKPHALGPGARAELDASLDDVFLVSQNDRAQLIGRPWIYFVVDAFSTMTIGLHAGFRHPSWEAGRMAILNSAMDKVGFCGRYDIAIELEDWPFHHLCPLYLADRGELIGKKSDQLVRELHVRIANAPRGRGDRKPHVERRFRTVQDNVTHWAPGRNHNLKGRKGKEYRYDALLTLQDYLHLVLLDVLEHNNHRVIQDRRALPPDYPVGRLGNPTPRELFFWGIENRSGLLTTQDPERMRFALLPTERCRVDKQRGIRFNHAYYVPEDEALDSWFMRNLGDGPMHVERKHDESDASRIWVRAHKTRGWSAFQPGRTGDRWVCGLSRDEVDDEAHRGRAATARKQRQATAAHVAFRGLGDQRVDEARAAQNARLAETGTSRITITGTAAAKVREEGRPSAPNQGASVVTQHGDVADVSAARPASNRRERERERLRRLDEEARQKLQPAEAEL